MDKYKENEVLRFDLKNYHKLVKDILPLLPEGELRDTAVEYVTTYDNMSDDLGNIRYVN